MRPKSLTLSGWGPYKEICRIDFEAFAGKGLFLITGATGAGKTTIFDAICFALYGSMSGEMREKNSVRSDFADADTKTYVELTMEHAGQVYRIYRNPEYERLKKRKTGSSAYTKEKENAILYLPDGGVIEGSNEVTKRIQELLVLNLKQFKQISMIAQGEFSRLLMAPSKEKVAIFREIFGTEVYESFENILKQRSKGLRDKADALKQRLEQVVRMLTLPEEDFLKLTDVEHLNFDAIQDYLTELQKEYKKSQRNSEKEYEQVDKEITSLAAQIVKYEELNRRISKCREAQERLFRLKEKEPEMKALEKEWKQAQNASYLEPLQIKLISMQEHLATKQGQLKQTKEKIRVLKQEKKELHKIFTNREKIADGLRLTELCEELTAQVTEQQKKLEKLKQEMEALQEEYLVLETACREKRKDFEEADYAYKRATAGIVARLLQEGKPCPVCGSTSHPAPAHAGEDVPDEKKLKTLQKNVQEAEKKLQQLHILMVAKKAEADAMSAGCKELSIRRELEEKKLESAQKYLEEFKELSAQQAYERLEEITGRYQSLEGLITEKDESITRLQEEIKQEQDDVQQNTAELKRQVKEYGFAGIAQYEKSHRTPQWRRDMEDALRNYSEESYSLKELVKQLKKGIEKKEPMEVSVLRDKMFELEKKKEEKLKEQKDWTVQLDSIKRTLQSLKEKLEELNKVSEEYGYVKDLDNTANGLNPKKLQFEQYVLASYFEEILRAANIRLLKMTSGRFEMSRQDKVGDGRSRDNLEIQVMDYYTGKNRPIKTLSGGETFKASLALALGMSDVIQAFHGGIRVDTLFVDEGFGSLDAESLDQACETLSSLTESDRLIGIISHVPELRERIDSQLVVQKTSSGSTIKIMI